MNKRPTIILCVLGAVLALTTACGQARAGNAVPKGDDAAAYVGTKFEAAMNKLQDTIGDQRDVTSESGAYFRFDEQYIRSTISSARAGSPESRVSRHRSQKNPDDSIDWYTPGDGTVEYAYLGPVYKSLAPTPWVSMPKSEAGLTIPCAWSGIITACKMADAIAVSYNADKKIVKGAKSLPENRIELTAAVPFGKFIERRVEVLPPKITGAITDEMKKAPVLTTVSLNADGTLNQIVMDAKIEGGGHKIELRYDFRFTGKATAQDMPKLPDASQITVLPDKAAKDDFNRRFAELKGV
ncbi:hypothetical protein [Amycolatopsis regifaucium]|uniref:Uncharacterized protein n=1 Tax=Amycolatopsis regifaucium TaxID=546365 RepID=A0A154MBU4_9PSEU|nr:hypothetical protein [Amycolatopsis regifaucium]KZB82088.1 hypothetical protein AVL48_09070 [Amycolatopsis regifaucium]OKA05840.1 hypothetical protein ATP06_0221920 [Amycolatopsis regifaucium]SFG82182.1 hypothetical protein SAMN04489731_101595 [Amycolatopsis regifaucium]